MKPRSASDSPKTLEPLDAVSLLGSVAQQDEDGHAANTANVGRRMSCHSRHKIATGRRKFLRLS
jgi:hypothetical protein